MRFPTTNPLVKAPSRIPSNPEVMVGGVTAQGESHALLEPVWHGLASALRSEHVRFITSQDGVRVWFIGARDQDFDGAGEHTTRLACALPGHPLHRGEGAYLDMSGASPAMALVQNGQLSVRTGSRESLERMAAGKDLPVYEAPAEATQAWDSLPALEARHAFKLFSAWIQVGVALLIFAGALGLLSLVQTDKVLARTETVEVFASTLRSQLLEAVSTANQNPLSSQLARLQRVQALVLKYDGAYIKRWALEKNEPVFEVVLPLYVRAEDYRELGPKVATRVTDEGLVLTHGLEQKK
jgi:hypothetical protein